MRGMQSSSSLDPNPQPRPELNQEPHLSNSPRDRESQSASRQAFYAPRFSGRGDASGELTGDTTVSGMAEPESDGRPAWLRRWTTEVRRDIAVERYSARKDPASTPGEDRLPTRDPRPAFDTLRGPQGEGTYTNGYTGQSIEAALNFETASQLATDFEAEATEDRLSLSNELPIPDLPSSDLQTSTLPILDRGSSRASAPANGSVANEGRVGSVAAGKPWIERLEPRSLTSEEEAARSVETGVGAQSATFPNSLPRLDPQAVRAAIFRLAQEAPTNRDAAAVSPQARFADIAFELWRDSDRDSTVEDGNDLVAAENRWEPERSEDLGSPTDTLNSDPSETSVSCTFAEPGILAQAQNHFEPADKRKWPNLDEEYHLVPAERQSRKAEETEKINETESKFNAPTLQRSMEASEISEIERIIPPSIPASDASLGARKVTAADAPALAHDAGNLLSALTLYSELLALSGVLHARHKHYAQDLKLLATRSEVLISRLLASCNAAESKAQSLMRENALGLAAAPGMITVESEPILPEAGAARPADPSDAAIEQADLEVSAQTERSVEAAAGPRQQGDGAIREATSLPSSQPQSEEIEEAVSTGMDEVASLVLADLLTGWRSLLSIIGRGSIEVNLGPNAFLPIRIKEDAMERILVNLVHNAMTATRSGGSIRIGVGRLESPLSVRTIPSSDGGAQAANRLVLTVDDSGCGMSNEQIAQIFADTGANPLGDVTVDNRFRRGLGLQIVRELVASSGGELAIYSREGAGTRVEIAWPTVESETLPARRLPAPARSTPAPLRSDPMHDRNPPQSAAPTPPYTGSGSWRTADSTANDLKGAIAC